MVFVVMLDEPEFDIVARTNPDGKLNVRGQAKISTDNSNAVLVGENRASNATCSTTDTGGLALTELTFGFRYQRSGERVLATVVPRDGGIESSGLFPATLEFEDRELGQFHITLVVDLAYHPGRGATEVRESITRGGNLPGASPGN